MGGLRTPSRGSARESGVCVGGARGSQSQHDSYRIIIINAGLCPCPSGPCIAPGNKVVRVYPLPQQPVLLLPFCVRIASIYRVADAVIKSGRFVSTLYP